MSLPVFLLAAAAGATSPNFEQRVAVQIDLGLTGDVGLLVQAFVDGNNTSTITGITVGGTMTGGTNGTNGTGQTTNRGGTIAGGTALTLDAVVPGASFLGANGNARAGRIGPLALTGLQWVQVTCNDANGKPTLLCQAWSGVSGIPAGTSFAGLSTTPSQNVTTTTNDVGAMLFYSSANNTYAASATAPTTQRLRALQVDAQGYNAFVWDRDGQAGTTTMSGSITGAFTPGYAGTKWVVQGTAGTNPVVTGPSGAPGDPTSTANLAENATTGPLFSTDIAPPGGYPTITGADASLFALVSVGTNQWRVNPVTPFNFESLPHANPFAVTFNANASVSQACSITITNVTEPPPTPTIGTAVAGDAQASVAFTPGAANGSPATANYVATSTPGGLTGSGTSSPITVAGLTNGTPYTFRVHAVNADGPGPQSADSNSVTPTGGTLYGFDFDTDPELDFGLRAGAVIESIGLHVGQLLSIYVRTDNLARTLVTSASGRVTDSQARMARFVAAGIALGTDYAIEVVDEATGEAVVVRMTAT